MCYLTLRWWGFSVILTISTITAVAAIYSILAMYPHCSSPWHIVTHFTYQIAKGKVGILKEIHPEIKLEGLMLKLKLQYFGHLIWRANSLEKTLMLGKIEDRRRGWQRMRWLDGVIDSLEVSLSKFWEIVKYREAWLAAVHGVAKSQTWLSDWTTTLSFSFYRWRNWGMRYDKVK